LNKLSNQETIEIIERINKRKNRIECNYKVDIKIDNSNISLKITKESSLDSIKKACSEIKK